MTEQDPAHGELKRDQFLDKPGIVGARWWHQSLMAEDQRSSRRQVLIGLAIAGGAVATISMLGIGLAAAGGSSSPSGSGPSWSGPPPEATSLATRKALEVQRQFGWDFGARGVPLVFDGVAEVPFVRTELEKLPGIMAVAPAGPNAKYQVTTLLESLLATPAATLPAPPDGGPRTDSAQYRRIADVLVPIATPAMAAAYRVGEALARLAAAHAGLAVLADLPGPDAVALAAGAAAAFEPVLLLDNWPHPSAVVPSHLALAALAYYQPRFGAKKDRASQAPLFVLDRLRTSPYSEESDRFDNRYLARMPGLDALGKDGVKTLLYVVASPAALPEPADLNRTLSAGTTSPEVTVSVRAIALTDFATDPSQAEAEPFYGGSPALEAKLFDPTPPAGAPPEALGAASPVVRAHAFPPRQDAAATPPPTFGHVPVIIGAGGLILAAALDRRGSMNRFASSSSWGGG